LLLEPFGIVLWYALLVNRSPEDVENYEPGVTRPKRTRERITRRSHDAP
jgi:hypothetical protein